MPAMPASSLELDQEPRRKRFLGGTHPCDSIGTVASQLTAVVYYEEKQISIPRPPQRIGLDPTRTPSAVLGLVVNVNLQPVRSSVTNQLKRKPASPSRYGPWCNPCWIQIGAHLGSPGNYRHPLAG